MTERISLNRSAASTPEPAVSPLPEPSMDFRSALHDAARSLATGEASMDAAMARLGHGRALSPEELIALQGTVYRYAAEVEMAAKLTDKLTNAVRTTLTSQQ